MTLIEVLAAARYIMALLFVLTLLPSVGYWFILHPFVRFWRRVGPVGTYLAMAAFFVGSAIALYAVVRPLLAAGGVGDYGVNGWLAGAGLALLTLAAVIQRKRKKYLDFKTLVGLPELAPERHGGPLFTEGIYGVVRHPRYLEMTLGVIGWALILNYLLLYLMAAATLVLLLPVMLLEERELRQRYGAAYDAYARRVPRFLPRLPRRPAASG